MEDPRAKLVKFVDKNGKVIREVHMNRAQRRRLGIKVKAK